MEHLFLTEAARLAEERYGVSAGGFVTQVERRLAMGEARYGDQWVTADLPLEAGEESWDGGAYAVLEAQKRLATNEDDPLLHHAHEIAIAAAKMHYHATCLRRNVEQ